MAFSGFDKLSVIFTVVATSFVALIFQKNLEPMRCLSPTSIPVSFSIGCGKPLSNIEHRIPSPTDEALNEPDEDLADCEIDVETTSGGVSPSFIPECPDLNVDEIENEDDV